MEGLTASDIASRPRQALDEAARNRLRQITMSSLAMPVVVGLTTGRSAARSSLGR